MPTLFNQKIIDEIMTAYTQSLNDELGENLKAVILFGSCARGDHKTDSDIDVFVLVEDDRQDIKKSLDRIANKYSWDYDTIICDITRTTDHYKKHYWETLFQNIRAEGRSYYGMA